MLEARVSFGTGLNLRHVVLVLLVFGGVETHSSPLEMTKHDVDTRIWIERAVKLELCMALKLHLYRCPTR